MGTPDRAFQEIFKYAAVGIAQIDLDGTFLHVNDWCCQILGYSEAELLNKTLREIDSPEGWTEFLTGCRLLQDGAISSHSVEKRYVRKDGTVFWARLQTSLVRNDHGMPQYFITVLEDIGDKRQVEQALREREEQFVLAQSAARLGVWDRDLGTEVTITSGHYAQLRGLQPDSDRITHGEWLAIIHPDDRERVQAALRECIGRKRIWDEEFRVVWPDGSVHWLLAKGQVFLDADGQPGRMAGVSLDITERKRVDEELRRSEQMLGSIYNTVRDVIFHLSVEPNGQFRFVSVNEAFLRVTGLGRETVIGKTVNEVIPEPSLGIVLRKYRQAIEEKTNVVWEETSDYPTGRLIGEVSIAPVFDEKGTCTHLVGAVHDITERKRAEGALRDSEERFRNLADSAPVMIWLSGLDKGCTFFNKPWLEFTGRTMGQELGDGWASGVHPDDSDRCFAVYSSSFDARRSFQMEYRLRRADGEYRWILDNGTPHYRDGEFVGFIGSCIDVTERKAAEEQLRAKAAALQNSEEELQALAGRLFTVQEDERRRLSTELHDDITQRLAFLSIELGKLVACQPDSRKQMKLRIRGLQDQVLQLCSEVRRVSHGLHPSVIEDFGLSIALEEFCHQFGALRGIKVNFERLIEDSHLKGAGATCLYRVAQESLHNAVVHGGATEIRVELTSNAGFMQLRVQDNGTGFPVDGTRTKTGLGLISMRERVRSIHGRLTICSEPNRGTEIVASIPLIEIGDSASANCPN